MHREEVEVLDMLLVRQEVVEEAREDMLLVLLETRSNLALQVVSHNFSRRVSGVVHLGMEALGWAILKLDIVVKRMIVCGVVLLIEWLL